VPAEAVINYIELHLGDYDKATAHLSACEDGIYGRLLRRYYDTEAPLVADVKALQRFVRARSREEQQAVETVLGEFFESTAEGWRHKRCDEEIAKYRAKSQKARESVSKRWAKRDAEAVPAQSERTTDAIPDEYERITNDIHRAPVPRHQTPDTNLVAELQVAGPAPSAAPKPAPPFDGSNAETLNGKHVVALAAGWELPEAWGVDAEALGWKPTEVLKESEKFRQYWVAGRGAGTRRSVKGWRQSWSTWLEKAARDHR
jgi:uncharacterized protein YdaU (DUF1376 family)